MIILFNSMHATTFMHVLYFVHSFLVIHQVHAGTLLEKTCWINLLVGWASSICGGVKYKDWACMSV